MEQKLVKFFEKVNQIRKEAIALDGSPKDKMDYIINKMNVLLTSDKYEMHDWRTRRRLEVIPETDLIEKYQLEVTVYNNKKLALEGRISGNIFHIFVMFDGDSSVNDLNTIYIFDKEINEYLNYSVELHDQWSIYLNEINEPIKIFEEDGE